MLHSAGIAILARAGSTHVKAFVGRERDEVVEHKRCPFLLEDRAAALPVGESMNEWTSGPGGTITDASAWFVLDCAACPPLSKLGDGYVSS